MSRICIFVSFVCFYSLLIACSSGSSNTTGTTFCAANTTVSCPCPDGIDGSQTCNSQGTGFLAECSCATEPLNCSNGGALCGAVPNADNLCKGGECVIECHEGYYELVGNCLDIDECKANNGGCSANATCTNTSGGRECLCNDGFTGNGLTCTDIDECDKGLDTCHSLATCTNEMGSYSCTCNEGYEGDGTSCSDTDDCATEANICGQICIDKIGGLACDCEEGYALNLDGISCADVDECETENGGCADLCLNKPGFHACGCSDGYVLNDDGITCTDIDECSNDNGGCSDTCTNTDGGFFCSCDYGFMIGDDGLTCEVDPCPEPGTAFHWRLLQNSYGAQNWFVGEVELIEVAGSDLDATSPADAADAVGAERSPHKAHLAFDDNDAPASPNEWYWAMCCDPVEVGTDWLSYTFEEPIQINEVRILQKSGWKWSYDSLIVQSSCDGENWEDEWVIDGLPSDGSWGISVRP